MKSSVLQIRGNSAQTARAQAVLSRMSGVVAAEFVPGRNAVRVYCGDELTREMLLEPLRMQGLTAE